MSDWLFCPCQKWWTYFCDIRTHTSSPVLSPCSSPSSPCVYCNPSFPWETLPLVSYDIIHLLPHLVCQAPWSLESTNVIFQEQLKEMGITMVSRPFIWNFLYFWPQNRESFLQMLALIVLLWNYDCPGSPLSTFFNFTDNSPSTPPLC
jgi:hypothetical protein